MIYTPLQLWKQAAAVDRRRRADECGPWNRRGFGWQNRLAVMS